ncbi:MAG: hypothetical protein IJW98_01165 [Clostridia bacterium]|nr:hypothetical protein [Clostridia bacterium]
MKKTLSFVLVAAMLLCMIPAFSLFAGELDLTTIDTPDELVALAEAANAAGRDYRKGETIKVTADLDMTGKNYTPINKGIFTLDFDGHTLSNLNVTVENPGGDVGLLAHRLENNNANGLITNVKIKNCSLTVKGNGSSNVGIIGYADRANVTNVEIDGFTINHEGAGNVAVLMGAKAWGFDSNISATMKNVVIDAPYANVAVVCGKVEGNDKFNLVSLSAEVTVKASLNDVANDTLFVTGADKMNVTADAVSATVTDEQDGKRTNYKEIGTADDLIALATAYNKFGRNFLGSQEIKITADIDMTGKAWTPIKDATFTLNGQGHTITGLSVTVDSTAKGDYGLLVNNLENNPGNGRIKDLTIKDSIITVTSTATELSTQYAGNKGVNVGAVVGRSNRGALNNISLENVTVKVTGVACVGALAGFREWEAPDDVISGSLKNVLIDAPDAQAGVISGYSYHVDGSISNFTAEVGGNVTDDAGAVKLNGATGDAYAKTEGENVTVTLKADATGCCLHTETKVEGKVEATKDAEGYTGDTVCADCGKVLAKGQTTPKLPATKPVTPAPTGDSVVALVVLAVVSLLGVAVFSKKRV